MKESQHHHLWTADPKVWGASNLRMSRHPAAKPTIAAPSTAGFTVLQDPAGPRYTTAKEHAAIGTTPLNPSYRAAPTAHGPLTRPVDLTKSCSSAAGLAVITKDDF